MQRLRVSAKRGDTEWTSIEIDRGHLGTRYGRRALVAADSRPSQKRLSTALREGRTTVEGGATFEDGYRTQRALDAARRSNEKAAGKRYGIAVKIEN
jgi:predicted dehydrogenase